MNPVRYMLINTVLWLPLGFFLWFILGSVFVWPVGKLSIFMANTYLPDVFNELIQIGKMLNFDTLLDATGLGGKPGQQAVFVLEVNPMVYGYGIPLIMALVMSTPLSRWQKIKQLTIGFAIITVVQAWGVFCELLKNLQFKMGQAGLDALADTVLTAEIIALMYQTAYLILPGVVPIALWVLMNREFVEQIVMPDSQHG